MNKIHYISLAFAFALVGCSDRGDTPQTGAISFRPSVDATRAVPVTTDNLQQIAVYATRSDGDSPYFNDVAVRGADGTFSFATPRYWLPGAALNFYAVTTSEDIENLAVADGTISFDYDATTSDADILVGYAFSQQYQGHAVELPLKHALALVEFAVAYEEDADGNKVSKIDNGIYFTELALYNMAATGRCSAAYSGISWTHGTAEEWTVKDLTSADSEGLCTGRDIFAGDLINTADRSKAFVVIPGQTLTRLRITFIEGRPKPYVQTIDITPTPIEPGKRYVFNLAIKSNYVSLTGTKITDWVSSNSTDVSLQ